MEPLKKQFQYILGAYKTRRLPGLWNYTLRVIDGLFLPHKVLAQPTKILITTIDGICNLKCRMCDVPKSTEKKEITFEEFRAILNKVKYCIELKLTGSGETLMAKDLLKIIAYAKRKGIHVSFYTNGLLLDKKKANGLIKLRLDEITFSLNAATPESYEYIMGGVSFENAIGNIRTLVESKKELGSPYPSISISFVAMRRNMHELPSFILLASELGVKKVRVHALAVNESELGILEESLCKELLFAEKYIREAKRLAIEKGIYFYYPSYRHEKIKFLSMCQEPWTKMVISIAGDVTPCCRFLTSFGNIFKDDISKIWNGGKYRTLRRITRDNRLPCKYCYDMARKLGIR